MGGMSSGRKNQCGKRTTEDCRSLDVRQFQRDGLLDDGKSFGWNWTRNGEKMAQSYRSGVLSDATDGITADCAGIWLYGTCVAQNGNFAGMDCPE